MANQLDRISAVNLWPIELPQTFPVSGCLVRGVIEGEIRNNPAVAGLFLRVYYLAEWGVIPSTDDPIFLLNDLHPPSPEAFQMQVCF